jgi:hypothetical protein
MFLKKIVDSTGSRKVGNTLLDNGLYLPFGNHPLYEKRWIGKEAFI